MTFEDGIIYIFTSPSHKKNNLYMLGFLKGNDKETINSCLANLRISSPKGYFVKQIRCLNVDNKVDAINDKFRSDDYCYALDWFKFDKKIFPVILKCIEDICIDTYGEIFIKERINRVYSNGKKKITDDMINVAIHNEVLPTGYDIMIILNHMCKLLYVSTGNDEDDEFFKCCCLTIENDNNTCKKRVLSMKKESKYETLSYIEHSKVFLEKYEKLSIKERKKYITFETVKQELFPEYKVIKEKIIDIFGGLENCLELIQGIPHYDLLGFVLSTYVYKYNAPKNLENHLYKCLSILNLKRTDVEPDNKMLMFIYKEVFNKTPSDKNIDNILEMIDKYNSYDVPK